MGVSTSSSKSSKKGPGKSGITVVTVDYPPVNALPVDGWFALADAVRTAGRDPDVRCVVLAAEGRGFSAGWTSRRYRRKGVRPWSG